MGKILCTLQSVKKERRNKWVEGEFNERGEREKKETTTESLCGNLKTSFKKERRLTVKDVGSIREP